MLHGQTYRRVFYSSGTTRSMLSSLHTGIETSVCVCVCGGGGGGGVWTRNNYRFQAVSHVPITCNAALYGRMEMFYLTSDSTHFIYGYMASGIW